LLADTLHCARHRAAPLAHLVHEKTVGNPVSSSFSFFYAPGRRGVCSPSSIARQGAPGREPSIAFTPKGVTPITWWTSWSGEACTDTGPLHPERATPAAGLPGQQCHDHNPVVRAREDRRQGPRRAVGGSPSGTGLSAWTAPTSLSTTVSRRAAYSLIPRRITPAETPSPHRDGLLAGDNTPAEEEAGGRRIFERSSTSSTGATRADGPPPRRTRTAGGGSILIAGKRAKARLRPMPQASQAHFTLRVRPCLPGPHSLGACAR